MNRSSGGIGCVLPFTLLFVALKLTGVIDWSWWWVLAPVWLAAILVVITLVALLAGVYYAETHKDR